jgi:ATP-dependent helicase HrpB
MNFEDLPVQEIIPELSDHLSLHNRCILTAPPGAGKSTLVPIALYKEKWMSGKKIIMLEPRRLAARSIAHRMSSMLNQPIGETVGYRIKFDQKVSSATKIEVVTEGILTRKLQQDNALEDVGMIIFDEFHERSIHADLALTLCLEIQQVLRPDLRLLVMSATLNLPDLEQLLGISSIKSEGKSYPVSIQYAGNTDLDTLPQHASDVVVRAMSKNNGDVLVFLPGQAEILKTRELLNHKLPAGIRIYPLYGRLPQNQQDAALSPSPKNQRKVVLATSIAQTSLTIEGITIVVDGGFERYSQYDPKTGLTGLKSRMVSQDAATQRAGRAGRIQPGVCYRLWNKATESQMRKHDTPEILEADLAALVLELRHFDPKPVEQFQWLDAPPPSAVNNAFTLLNELEAIDEYGLTEHGKSLLKMPVHPRIAHMLQKSLALNLGSEAAEIAAILEEKDPLTKEEGVDLNKRIEALRRISLKGKIPRAFARIDKNFRQYLNMVELEAPTSTHPDPYQTGLILTLAYPDRIASARPGNNAVYQLSNGKIVQMGHQDDLAHEPWLAVAWMDDREKVGKIFSAAPLDPTDLRDHVKKIEKISWEKEGLQAKEEWRIGAIVLKNQPLINPSEQLIRETLIETLKKSGSHLLDFNERVVQLQNRVLSLKKWDDGQWPDFSTTSLMQQLENWLLPYLEGIRKTHQLKKLDLFEILFHSLTYDQQQDLNKLVPEYVKVPTGSKIKLKYQPNGDPPTLAVRIQEVFGLEKTPCVYKGQIPVLLHLLSPGFKPIQVTRDLRSFWDNTYQTVKKELFGRYPKHYWPENPLLASPTRKTKRR